MSRRISKCPRLALFLLLMLVPDSFSLLCNQADACGEEEKGERGGAA